MKRKEYEELLEPLTHELLAMSRWLQHTGRRVAVLLEGRDTAGKGGVIEAISEGLNPRHTRVVALRGLRNALADMTLDTHALRQADGHTVSLEFLPGPDGPVGPVRAE